MALVCVESALNNCYYPVLQLAEKQAAVVPLDSRLRVSGDLVIIKDGTALEHVTEMSKT